MHVAWALAVPSGVSRLLSRYAISLTDHPLFSYRQQHSLLSKAYPAVSPISR